jgi:hypothetical protein
MKSLQHILSESIRQGLPHISTMDHKQFHGLVSNGKLEFGDHNVTEKTDGMTHKFGYDDEGFYTQSSGSGGEKMRRPEHYHERATRRASETGKPLDLTAANAFSHIHKHLQDNEALQKHLHDQYHKTKKEVAVRGEVFYKPLSRPSEEHPGEVKFVGTSYHPGHMGSVGKYVIHSKLPENADHDVHHFAKHLSSSHINFDHDKVENVPTTHLDVSDHAHAFRGLNHELLNSRTTPKNKAAKQKEMGRFDKIRRRLSNAVDKHVNSLKIRNRWGSGSEGLVVHPSQGAQSTRFKVTSNAFRNFKASDAAKNFKKRAAIAEAIAILTEGGSMKIGDAAAMPISTKNRPQVQNHVESALRDIHNSFHEEHGQHLFGRGARALRTGSAYSGSTRHLMNKAIPDEEFHKHKPAVGDIDVQVTPEHKNMLQKHLAPGRKFGKYTVVGTAKHGTELSAVMRHDNGEHHQVDFEGVEYHDHEPTHAEQFLHSSAWEDMRSGIKGAHHKMLINSTGLDTHKFSITHGLRSRTDEKDPGDKEPHAVSNRLFGHKADHSRIHSFHGVAELIHKHIPSHQHQEIYNRFKASVSKKKGLDSTAALKTLREKLGISDDLNESEDEAHHTSVIPLTGFDPISHMGHAHDLGSTLNALPGPKHVGVSGKASLFSPEERSSILNRQWGSGHNVHVVKSAGETIRRAHDSLPADAGRRVLHLVVGHDRKAFAHGLRKSLMDGKIKEMEGRKFDDIHIHHPDDTNRSHGMSGTKMRQSVADGNFDEFHRHLGPMFKKREAQSIFRKIGAGIKAGAVKIKRSLSERIESLSTYM